jgi:formylglycine-generating enzyme required for sulfatase activity
MKRGIADLSLLMTLMATAATMAQTPVIITSYTPDSIIGWSYPTSGVAEYRIQWGSTITGTWTDIRCGFQGIPPTNQNMSAEVPRFFRILALPQSPTGMVYVPAGSFLMGNSGDTNEAFFWEHPRHSVFVSGFWMDRCEVTKSQWDEIYQWAGTNGYDFENAGQAKGTNHPVHTVNWYDAAKWANARSERDGLIPCYYTDSSLGTVYRSGVVDLQNGFVDWSATGYRLPTEAEWEKAARGGLNGQRFPWGMTIAHNLANYYSATNWPEGGYLPTPIPYDTSPTHGYHPTYNDGTEPYTSPVGSFAPNGYGLYDMVGNLWEYCWDRFDYSWYSNPTASAPDTPGPETGGEIVTRGSAWRNDGLHGRVSYRGPTTRTFAWYDRTFRCVRR